MTGLFQNYPKLNISIQLPKIFTTRMHILPLFANGTTGFIIAQSKTMHIGKMYSVFPDRTKMALDTQKGF